MALLKWAILFILIIVSREQLVSSMVTEQYQLYGDKIDGNTGEIIETVKSKIECAVRCSSHECLGVNLHPVSSGLYECRMLMTTVVDKSTLVPSTGDVHISKILPDYWQSYSTGVSGFTKTCSQCICEKLGCESLINVCNTSPWLHCGPYKVGFSFWCDANYITCDNTHEPAFKECTKKVPCSQATMAAYMDRFKGTCSLPHGCRDFAALYAAGPSGCSSEPSWFPGWYADIDICCSSNGGG